MTRVRAAVGLGANVGDRAAALATAAAGLGALPGTRVVAVAKGLESAAEGGPRGQPPFLNTAVTLETALDPRALVSACRRLEHAAGRRRVEPWAPRPLDCDLLLHGDAVVDTFALRLPHPRLHGRLFVLEPLAAIAGDWVEPVSGRTVTALLEAWRVRHAAAPGPPAVLSGIAAVRRWRAGAPGNVALVPTMGALHDGHRALLRVARQECDRLVASIYVNPLQFGPREDFAAYPRTLDADLAACAAERVDAVAVFDDAEMYPPGHDTRVVPGTAAAAAEGAHRPGHFTGVATVVAKLLHLVQPHRAYFGQKDAQQCAVIRRMARDLDWPVSIEVLPTVRAPDGLALSSRNAYLSAAERTTALALSAALRDAAAAAAEGERDAASLRRTVRGALDAVPGLTLDYAEVVDPDSFLPLDQIADAAVAAVAARVGRTRLIDNMVCWPPPGPGPDPGPNRG